MILYKPINKTFLSRKELKKFLGANRYKNLIKFRPEDIVFIMNNIAINDTTEFPPKELYNNE